ncbi:MAG: preprotein translocase subunit SecE [Candidatus Schekmanbacteria bacterium]|nr:MAG: preprotein translocase subunit SecE [Candidatus Schekmanbacteria bacterium]
MFKKLKEFLMDVRSEFKKVTWPSKPETYDSTKVVIVVVIVIAFYLGLVDIVLSSGVKKLLNESPVGVFSVDPKTGDVGTSFTFDASGSYDSEDGTRNLKVRWDFEGDGKWDYPSKGYTKNKIIVHKFDKPGLYTVRLQVMDSQGAVAVVKRNLNVTEKTSNVPDNQKQSTETAKKENIVK